MTREVSLSVKSQGWTHKRPDVWQDRASCLGKSHLFDVIEIEEDSEPKEAQKIRRKNRKNYKEAASICADCPVFQECEADATPEDLAFTFRAGHIPTSAPLRVNDNSEFSQSDICKRGHVGRWRFTRGTRECRECKLELGRARKTGERVNGGERCPKGHQNWTKDSTGSRRCVDCKKDYEAKRMREFDPADYADRVCKNGHIGMYAIKAGKVMCGECAREYNRRQYHKKKLKAATIET